MRSGGEFTLRPLLFLRAEHMGLYSLARSLPIPYKTHPARRTNDWG